MRLPTWVQPWAPPACLAGKHTTQHILSPPPLAHAESVVHHCTCLMGQRHHALHTFQLQSLCIRSEPLTQRTCCYLGGQTGRNLLSQPLRW